MSDHFDRLFARFLSGEATSHEANELQFWLNADPKNREEFNRVALTYQLSKGKKTNHNNQRAFDGIVRKIGRQKEIILETKNSQNKILRIGLSVAASLLIILSVGTFYLLNSTKLDHREINPNSWVLKSNPAGQKLKVFLPDGSIVWLNSESSLRYEKDFNDSIRFVEVQGEAYFEVKKDSLRPFVVKSKSVLTTALGTSFNVNCYGDREEVIVSLTSGRVLVQKDNSPQNNNSLIINPGEGVVYYPTKNEALYRITIDIESVKNWKDGILELKEASLNETITKLSRWYGVELILRNKPTRKWDATGAYDNEYLDNILNALSFSYGFDYELKGKQVYIPFRQNE